MKRAMANRQRDLFEMEAPPTALPPARRAKLVALLQALLLETFTDIAAVVREDDHEQDHA